MKHHELYETYDKNVCWQYDIRQKNLYKDYKESGLTKTEINNMRTKDFTFSYVDKTDLKTCDEHVAFIERHEWLGKMPNRPTHRFEARYKGLLAGVMIFTVPNSFSKLIGEDTYKLEKLISRGACISWSPKNLNSWLVMKSIKWMITNTEYRLFTAYSDTEAKELGAIYQACSFIYLGKTSGSALQFLDPNNEKIGWFNDRHFRHKSMYKKYAETLGIDAKVWKSYMKKYSPDWTIIPEDIKIKIKNEIIRYRKTCKVRTTQPKHKYVYIKGRNKNETKKLMRLFNAKNKPQEYPKVR